MASDSSKTPHVSGEEIVLFEIADDNRRQACSLKTTQSTRHDALMFFRQNWPIIERDARTKLAKGDIDGGIIYLEQSLIVLNTTPTDRDRENT